MYLLIIILILFSSAILFISLKKLKIFLHILQLEKYRTKYFIKWILRNPFKIFSFKERKIKKELVFTPRAQRLYGLSGILLIFIFCLMIILYYDFILKNFKNYLIIRGILGILIGSYIISQFTVVFLVIANILLYPLETVINSIYVNLAKRKIHSHKLLKIIAITGSYGKTSVKEILSFILSSKFKVLKTPHNYNTLLGITKVIREELKSTHEIFIVEMGACKKGDIKQLCNLTNPIIGILTTIGIQHLETFKNKEAILNTKYELIESLPQKGIAIFNYDDKLTPFLIARTKNKKIIRYSCENKEAEIVAEEISYNSYGTKFTVCAPKNSKVQFQTKLLGQHNISNILAAISVALECGMNLEQISEKIKEIKPIPHRLELIQTNNGITIIDDAYNANPVGIKNALEVLNRFEKGRKILVTPGLIELGKEEFRQNKILGKEAGKICDRVILIGCRKRKQAIFEGLKEVNFPEEYIYLTKNLFEAKELLKEIIKKDDIILFENDLPDNYEEL